ncbi:hypothetical protein [Paraburkholderia ginsengisoli]|uniref:Uncharacterized protein n=1 Tax=Paraburkholderia ginsengisoli TaxID=311231 RepID=A0A7T4T7G1_9BURK|nr:hypothetical protein [Paraburkholderia ginsengisoli]QQC62777.1 hypothetical protein I6I06_10605 [Paraburkholderia ginsengisoli]
MRKEDKLLAEVARAPTCEVDAYAGNTFTLCWVVKVTNLSEDKTVIVRSVVSQEDGPTRYQSSDFQVIPPDFEANTVLFNYKKTSPLTLDTGQTATLVVHLPLEMSEKLRTLYYAVSDENPDHVVTLARMFGYQGKNNRPSGAPSQLCPMIGGKPAPGNVHDSYSLSRWLASCDAKYRLTVTTAGDANFGAALPVGFF